MKFTAARLKFKISKLRLSCLVKYNHCHATRKGELNNKDRTKFSKKLLKSSMNTASETDNGGHCNRIDLIFTYYVKHCQVTKL